MKFLSYLIFSMALGALCGKIFSVQAEEDSFPQEVADIGSWDGPDWYDNEKNKILDIIKSSPWINYFTTSPEKESMLGGTRGSSIGTFPRGELEIKVDASVEGAEIKLWKLCFPGMIMKEDTIIGIKLMISNDGYLFADAITMKYNLKPVPLNFSYIADPTKIKINIYVLRPIPRGGDESSFVFLFINDAFLIKFYDMGITDGGISLEKGTYRMIRYRGMPDIHYGMMGPYF